MSTVLKAPEGTMQDAKGRYVPISLVSQIDVERDRLVRELMAIAKRLNSELTAAKGKFYGDVGAFIEMSADQYGVKRGGKKGNVTLNTFDGSMRVQIATADAITFSEQLEAAKALVLECAADWTDGSSDELKVLIQEVFNTDKEGNISVSRILSLRRWKIADPRWKEAMRAIDDSIQVTGQKTYIRFHERIGNTDRYSTIPLELGAV